MDQFMCRLPQPYPVGTEVTLIGKDGNEEITADERAEQLQTINYEITCTVHPRIPRIYWQNGEKIEISNPILSCANTN
jgi:alanine racemase